METTATAARLPVTGNGLITLVSDFEGQSRAATVYAAGYIRSNGKPNFTGFYEALMAARGETIPTTAAEAEPAIPRQLGDGPAVYVACLASYNAGRLYGSWLDLSDGPSADDIREAIQAIISESPDPSAEEYAIHDSQCLPAAFGEWPNIGELAEYCQAWAGMSSDDDAIAYLEACNYHGCILTVDQFQCSYRGIYKGGEDYAAEYVGEMGVLDGLPSIVSSAIDYEAVWRWLNCDGHSAIHVGSSNYAIFAPIP